MKITDVEALHLRLPQVDEIADGTQDVLIIRIYTAAGLVGIGEVSSQSYVCKAESVRTGGIARRQILACLVLEADNAQQLVARVLRRERIPARFHCEL